MDPDDLLSKRPDSLLAQLCREDLAPLSVDELRQRVTALEQEIGRIRARLQQAGSVRTAADQLFRS